MARFAIVAPPSILRLLEEHGAMGPHHLLLAHDIVKKPNQYHGLFYGLFVRGSRDRIVILDNSVIETGKAVDILMIKEAAATTLPTCIVLPDVLLDPTRTIESCTRALDEWPKYLPGYKFMFVPQGKTIQEFVACAEHFVESPLISTWGVPRNLVKSVGTRSEAVRLLQALNPGRAIHMLGFSDNMIDDVLCARNRCVTSIDSAVPLRVQQRLSMGVVPPPRDGWWEDAQWNDVILENLKIARRWFY